MGAPVLIFRSYLATMGSSSALAVPLQDVCLGCGKKSMAGLQFRAGRRVPGDFAQWGNFMPVLSLGFSVRQRERGSAACESKSGSEIVKTERRSKASKASFENFQNENPEADGNGDQFQLGSIVDEVEDFDDELEEELAAMTTGLTSNLPVASNSVSVGIDPDLSGAIAVLKSQDNCTLVEVIDVPCITVAVNKRMRQRHDYKSIATIVRQLQAPADSGAKQLSFSISRRQGLLFSAVGLLLSTLQGFGVLQSASAATEEALRLEKIRSEIVKVVSKGKAAGVLRLAFHDGGTFNLGTMQGGMNGSIIYELDRPESTGLKRSVRVLEKVKTALEPDIAVSWADLIAVAGAESVAICGGPKIKMTLGRLDSLSPDPEGQMPEETSSATELKKIFQQKGFSTQEMVALSGAHTIGNKGFGAPDIFDNTYYKTLIQKPWRDSQGTDMNSSMVGLASDRNLTDDSECMKWVNLYAEDEEKFFLDFSAAYLKLVSTGARWA